MTNNRERLLYILEQMMRIRRFEERCVALFERGRLPGFLHSYIGQEGVAVGVCAHLNAGDYITSTHRGHGHVIAKGGRTDLMMAELYGKATGYCRGKGGSMHIADGDIGILGANGIVGGGLEIAAGAGAGLQYLKKDSVCVCFFGDGAGSQGAFHESVNLAATWWLPVVYVNENNGYAFSTPNEKQRRVARFSAQAAAYGIPGVTVDGNDVTAVYEAAEQAVALARGGGGPTLLECVTCRWRGHSEGRPKSDCRTAQEIEQCRQKDPIPRFREYLCMGGFANEADFDAIDRALAAEIDAAEAFGESAPYPELSELTRGVYAAEGGMPHA